jgi:hypothetical protein
MSHRPSPASGPPADTSTSSSDVAMEPIISAGESLVNPTSVSTSGAGSTTPENGGTTSQQPLACQAPAPTGMRPRAPPNPPSLPTPRRRVDPHSFTLTPIPQGDILRGLVPPDEPRSLKDKIAAAATIIGRPFTKAELNWVMATLWPDTVNYLGKGQKQKGQAVRPSNL